MTSDRPLFTPPPLPKPRHTQLALALNPHARRPLRFAQVPAALSATLARLPRGALLVYLELLIAGGARAYGSRGVWITTGQLMERTGLSRDTVKRGRRRLMRAGVLRYHPGSGRRPTVYTMFTGEEELAAAAPLSDVAAEVLGMWKTRGPEGVGGRSDAPPGGASVHPPRPLGSRGLEKRARVRQLHFFNKTEIEALNEAAPGPGTALRGGTDAPPGIAVQALPPGPGETAALPGPGAVPRGRIPVPPGIAVQHRPPGPGETPDVPGPGAPVRGAKGEPHGATHGPLPPGPGETPDVPGSGTAAGGTPSRLPGTADSPLPPGPGDTPSTTSGSRSSGALPEGAPPRASPLPPELRNEPR